MVWFENTIVPAMIFLFAYLLFFNKTFCKWRLIYFAIMMALVELHAVRGVERIYLMWFQDWEGFYYLHSVVLVGVMSGILAYAVNRHNAISYDTLLKKEIWGVWAKDIGADKR